MSGSRSRSRPIWGQRSNKQDKLLHHSPICDPANIWIYRPICLWITSHQVMHHVLLDIRKEINWGGTVLLDFMWNWWLILEILGKFVFILPFFNSVNWMFLAQIFVTPHCLYQRLDDTPPRSTKSESQGCHISWKIGKYTRVQAPPVYFFLELL